MNIEKVNATLGKALRNFHEREQEWLQNQVIEDDDLETAVEEQESGEPDAE